MSRKIGIVGLGWLGEPLGQALQTMGMEVFGTCRSEEKKQLLRQKGLSADIWEFGGHVTCPDWLKEIDVLMITLPPGGNYPRWHEAIRMLVNVVGAQTKVLITSTTGVYRMGLKRSISIVTEKEDLSENPLLEAEQIVQQSQRPNVIFRLAGLVGGSRQPGRFLAGKKDVADPLAPVNLVHREDVVAAIVKAITLDISDLVINVCCDEHPTKQAFYTQMALKAGLEVPEFAAAESTTAYAVDNSLMKHLLGIQLKYPDPFLFP